MAFEFDLDGGFKVLEDVERAFGEIHGNAGDEILGRAGSKLSDLFKQAVEKHGHVDAVSGGQLRDSIRPSKAKDSNRGFGRYVDVFPHDSRTRGVNKKHKTRNAEIGFYLEHGVTRPLPGKSIQASHWMSNTVDDCAEDVLDIMENAINEIIDKNTGG